jgi:hypothetical protein
MLFGNWAALLLLFVDGTQVAAESVKRELTDFAGRRTQSKGGFSMGAVTSFMVYGFLAAWVILFAYVVSWPAGKAAQERSRT